MEENFINGQNPSPENNNPGQQAPKPQPYNYYGGQQAPPPQPQPYNYNQPLPPQQQQYQQQYGYGQNPYMQAVAPVEVMPNGIPVNPRIEEKKFIKKHYNITSWMLILNSFLPMVLLFFFLGFYELIAKFSKFPYGIDMSIKTSAIVLFYIISDLLIVFIGCKATNTKLTPLFNMKSFSASYLLMGAAIAIGMNLSAILVSSLLETGVENLFGVMLVEPDDTPPSFIYMIIDSVYAVLIAPFVEELVFRGFVLKNFSRYNVYTGIIMSGLLFGLMHGNFYQFIFTAPFGIALAYMTVKSNSIVPAMFTHFLANAGVTAINLVGLNDVELSDGFFVLWLGFFIVVGLIFLIIGLSSKMIRLPKNTKAEKKRGFPLVFTSHAVIIYIIIQLIECFMAIEKL